MSFRKRVVGTDPDDFDLVQLNEFRVRLGEDLVDRVHGGSYAQDRTVSKEYMRMSDPPMKCANCGNLNPANIPTRAKLADAVRDAMNAHPIAKEDRSFARFLQALEVMRTYLSWLPEEHREGGDRDLKYIERRLEELLMFRRFLKSFITKFRNRPGAAMAATEMFSNVMSFVRMLKETTGVDLEGSDT